MSQQINYKNKSGDEIIHFKREFISSWHAFQALSWFDFYKRTKNLFLLQYAALEVRNSIEFLFFEILVLGSSGNLTEQDYINCIKNRTKMHKIINKHIPNYTKWIMFNEICISIIPNSPKITFWDLNKLKNIWNDISNYLHFWGEPTRSSQSSDWIISFEKVIEDATTYLENNYENPTGLLNPKSMPSELHNLWDDFLNNRLTKIQLKTQLNIMLPILALRQKYEF